MSVARLRIKTHGAYNSKSQFNAAPSNYYVGAEVEYQGGTSYTYIICDISGIYPDITYNIVAKNAYINYLDSEENTLDDYLKSSHNEETNYTKIEGVKESELTPLNYVNKYMCKNHSCFTTQNNRTTSIYAKWDGKKQKYNKLPATIFMMNKQFLSLKNEYTPWHDASDKPVPSIDPSKGVGVDIKHNSYQRRLMKLKAKNSCYCF